LAIKFVGSAWMIGIVYFGNWFHLQLVFSLWSFLNKRVLSSKLFSDLSKAFAAFAGLSTNLTIFARILFQRLPSSFTASMLDPFYV
jgi:hypothetical protein